MSKFLNAPKGIVLFGMGTVGQAIARLLAERQWRVVAAVNRQGQKVGRDLGELAGAPALAGISVADSDGCDFAAFEAGWDPKPDAIQRIAETLNLGLDSFVFFDDDPSFSYCASSQCDDILKFSCDRFELGGYVK